MAEQLLIRFRGICGHIDLSNGTSGNGKRKRTVLVRHLDGNGAIERHVPYLEFFADDVQAPLPSRLNVLAYSRPGTDGRYARINLDDGTLIRLKDIPAGAVEEELGYRRDVPHMGEILRKVTVARSLLSKEAKDVDRNRATAVFDMPKGRLHAGEPEAAPTRFPPGVNFKERRLARWSDLYIAYDPPLVVELAALGSGETIHEITFKASLRMLTIGNEPERLILGTIGSPSAHASGHNGGHNGGRAHSGPSTPVQPTGHYVLYYNLLENAPAEKPVPIPAQIDGSGCPNNNYP